MAAEPLRDRALLAPVGTLILSLVFLQRLPGPFRAVEPRVDGIDSRVRALGARNWFGAYTVLEAEGPPLVLSVTPGPVRSPGLDLFAPASVLRSLLGYRVAEVIRLPRRDS